MIKSTGFHLVSMPSRRSGDMRYTHQVVWVAATYMGVRYFTPIYHDRQARGISWRNVRQAQLNHNRRFRQTQNEWRSRRYK